MEACHKPIFWIIDDDPTTVQLLAIRFQQFQFVLLQNRKMVLRRLKQSIHHSAHLCHGILLDYKLKYNIDAFDLLPTLRQHLPTLPISVITAYYSPELDGQFKCYNIDTIHEKPFDFEALSRDLQYMAKQSVDLNFLPYKKLVEHIHATAQDPNYAHCSLKTLTNKQNISYKYMSRAYKKQVGESFSETQARCLMKLACALLLDTQFDIQKIARVLGYKHPSSFMRFFKNQKGITPTEYRYQHGVYNTSPGDNTNV